MRFYVFYQKTKNSTKYYLKNDKYYKVAFLTLQLLDKTHKVYLNIRYCNGKTQK
jgi:hypothetical protein